MPGPKRQLHMDKENKKSYEAQSPKDFDDESVDDMLANVDQFIQGVYRDLSISPPQRSSLPNTSTFATRRSLNDNSSASSANASPTGCFSLTGTLNGDESVSVVSPSTRRNMDAEIERINRICDNVDQNLRSIGLFMNSSCDSNTSQDVLNSNLTSSPSSSASTSLTTLSINSPPVATEGATNRRGRPRRRSSMTTAPAHVIDLSETQTQTPEVLRQPLILNNHNEDDDDDDDVILVSANIHPVVDLCTPGGYQEAPRARSSVNQRKLNRRRLTQQDEDAGETCSSGPSPVRRRRTEYYTLPEYKKSEETSMNTEKSPNNSSASSATNGVGHTPFMCPVCMESCLQRQPTSTRCGHVFCKECIEHAIRLTHKCPMCNTKISKSQIFRIYL